jgi:shikimate kinase
MSIKNLAFLLLAATTAGCVSTGGVVTDPQNQQALVMQECAIYFAAEQRLVRNRGSPRSARWPG